LSLPRPMIFLNESSMLLWMVLLRVRLETGTSSVLLKVATLY
jgi:hypothetical protein